ncbi:MAG: hypothetical protein QXJ32_02430 [Thermoplasmata archaeon]
MTDISAHRSEVNVTKAAAARAGAWTAAFEGYVSNALVLDWTSPQMDEQ